MLSHDHRYLIVFNGEIYNYRSIRAELLSAGATFTTQSDTEVLLEGHRRWGPDLLRKISGMFAFAIWDTQQRTLFCARDRVGEKPFYYATVGGHFIFGSELKALLEWPDFSRTLDLRAVVDYLTFGFIPDPKTIWSAAAKLPPGHSMLIQWREGLPPLVSPPSRYWDLEFDPDYSEDDWGGRIRGALQDAVTEMSIADVPVGTFLSGGVDSSSVTAALARAGKRPRTFTIGFDEKSHDERKWARMVAELYDTQHTERVVAEPDVDAVLAKLVWHYDEPFNDYSYLPTYYLCKEAREVVTVALSGDGADEIFAGYLKYQRLALRSQVRKVLPPRALRHAASFAGHFLSRESDARRTLAQYSEDASTAFTDSLTVGFRPSALAGVSRGHLTKVLRHYNPREVVEELLTRVPAGKVGAIDAMRYLDLKLTLAGDILVKLDRASMAVSLEARPVYLNRSLVELASRLPAEKLATPRSSKAVLKEAFEPWLPREILNRSKQGFHMPLGEWIKSSRDVGSVLKPATANVLDELVDPQIVLGLEESHRRGSSDQTGRLHAIFFLGRWLEKWKPTGVSQ